MPRVRVLYFGIVRERLGLTEEWVDVAQGARISDLAAALSAKHGDLARGVEKIRMAVNLEYVDFDHVVRDNDEIAVIPPVSGG
jgi:molybdopterin converting factor subunit 1